MKKKFSIKVIEQGRLNINECSQILGGIAADCSDQFTQYPGKYRSCSSASFTVCPVSYGIETCLTYLSSCSWQFTSCSSEESYTYCKNTFLG